jgi:hypothetical protein
MPHLRIREIMDSLQARGNVKADDITDIMELITTCLAERSGENAPGSYEAMFPSKAAKHSFEYRQRQKNLTKTDGTDENLTEPDETDAKKRKVLTLSKEKNNINIYTHTKAKKGSRLPENWQPSLETLSYADKLGCSAAEIAAWAEDFRLWAYSASGQVSIKRDWESAFKGWMRREKAKGATNYQRKGNVTPIGSHRSYFKPEPEGPKISEEERQANLAKLATIKFGTKKL